VRHRSAHPDHCVVLSHPSCEIRCLECDIEIVDTVCERTDPHHALALFEFRKKLFGGEAHSLFPNSFLVSCLCLLFTDAIVRECLIKVADIEGLRSLASFNVLETLVGRFFKDLNERVIDPKLVEMIYRELIQFASFRGSYSPHGFAEFWETFVAAMDEAFDHEYLKTLVPKVERKYNKSETACRASNHKLGLIASQFGCYKFGRAKCEDCEVVAERSCPRGITCRVRGDRLSADKPNRFLSMFKRKPQVSVSALVSQALEEFKADPLPLECSLCSASLGGKGGSHQTVALPSNLLVCQDETSVERVITFGPTVACPQKANDDVCHLAFVMMRSGTHPGDVYYRVGECWFQVHESRVTPCFNFDRLFSHMSPDVAFASYRMYHGPEIALHTKISPFHSSYVCLPIPIVRRLESHPDLLGLYLSALFCDHFHLRPYNFVLNYSSAEALERSKEAALCTYETLCVRQSKDQFFAALYKQNLLEKYAANINMMAANRICDKCCQAEKKRLVLDTLQVSLKLKVLERKKSLGSGFLKENREMISLTFSDDFARQVGENLRTYSARTQDKENCVMNLSASFGASKASALNPVDVILGKKYDRMEISFGPVMTKFDSLVGQFEKTLMESLLPHDDLLSRGESVQSPIDVAAVLPTLKAAVSIASSPAMAPVTDVVMVKQATIELQSAVKQTVEYFQPQPLSEFDDPMPMGRVFPVSPIHRGPIHPQITVQPIDFIHQQQRNESLFQRKRPCNSGNKKHSSATDTQKCTQKKCGESMFEFKPKTQDFDKSDAVSAHDPIAPIKSDESGVSQPDILIVSPDRMESYLSRIDMSEFEPAPLAGPMTQRKMSKTPVSKRSIWQSAGQKDVLNSRANKTPTKVDWNTPQHNDYTFIIDPASGRKEDTPALVNNVHFFSGSDPFSILREEGILQDEADYQCKPGYLKSNQKSKFVNPHNNSILTDISRSECSSYQRSMISYLTMRLENETHPKKSTHHFQKAMMQVASRNLKLVVRRSLEVMNFERAVRLTHNVVKTSPVGFMLTIRKDKEAAPAPPKVINLAVSELSAQKASSWNTLVHSQAASGSLVTPKKTPGFYQSSIEKEAVVKVSEECPSNPIRNVFMEKLEEASEDSQKTQGSSPKFADGTSSSGMSLSAQPALSLSKIDSRFGPFTVPSEFDVDNVRLSYMDSKWGVHDPSLGQIGDIFLQGVNRFSHPRPAAPQLSITFGIEDKHLDANPLGARVILPSSSNPVRVLTERLTNADTLIDQQRKQHTSLRRAPAKCDENGATKKGRKPAVSFKADSENIDPKRGGGNHLLGDR
jgi:hypothetical protein